MLCAATLSFLVSAHPHIKPQALPTKLYSCIDAAYKNADFQNEAAGTLFTSCVSQYTAMEVTAQCFRMTNETLKYLGNLLKPVYKVTYSFMC